MKLKTKNLTCLRVLLKQNGAYCRLFAALHNGDPEWEEVYFDGAYAIYVRDVPENADLIHRTSSGG